MTSEVRELRSTLKDAQEALMAWVETAASVYDPTDEGAPEGETLKELVDRLRRERDEAREELARLLRETPV